MEAEVTLEYDDARTAEAVAEAVSPDNLKTPIGLSIKTVRKGRRVVTHVNYHGKLPTLIATIDDLLVCVSVAEKAVLAARELQ